MFQSFTGNSRRPRQVNLSGQSPNPFVGSSWGPAASGAQKTVATAQQERLQRQQERERVNATKRIQRTWRGHKARRELAHHRRLAWDNIEKRNAGQTSRLSTRLSEELRLLLAFFSSRNGEDILRLRRFSDRFLQASDVNTLFEAEFRPLLLRLARIVLASLTRSSDIFQPNILILLTKIVDTEPVIISRLATSYYEVLSSMVTTSSTPSRHKDLFLAAIRSPLTKHAGVENADAILVDAYTAFAMHFLATPNLSEKMGGLKDLAYIVNVGYLARALLQKKAASPSETIDRERCLWLLAQFISLHRLQQSKSEESVYRRALSVLLSSSANDIVGRLDLNEPEEASEDDDDMRSPDYVLPAFIKDELATLVNKENIISMLSEFNADYVDSSQLGSEEDATLLANYVLMLLRIFPGSGEEIRMWLYQGSVTVARSGAQIPAVKLFWRAMNTSRTFSAIGDDPKAALNLLRPRSRQSGSRNAFGEDSSRSKDWGAILLFLELYAFVLRFTDDEEFLNGGTVVITEPNNPSTRSRESALPLDEVKLLTVFLKNVSFTMYYNAAELTVDDSVTMEGGLGNWFGTSLPKKAFGDTPRSVTKENSNSKPESEQVFLDIPGMTFTYVRHIVTRVMRMLYERDSRRRFLPKDHWLMTSRFDMAGFIPAVVMEEERRHQITEEGEDQDLEEPSSTVTYGTNIGSLRRPPRAHQLVHLEAMRRQQQKTARTKVLAAVGPRLEILQNMPFAIPFKTRVEIFRQFVYQDQVRRRSGHVDPDHWRMSVIHGSQDSISREILGRHHAKIRRDNVFEDALEQFYSLGEGLKEPIQITFVDRFDTAEEGIDGGGVTKEFLTSVTNEAFRDANGPNLFVTNDQNLLYPNPAALDERREFLRQSGIMDSDPEWRENMANLLKEYEFLGRIVGKCLYEGILVDIGFAGFFLLKWASTDGAGSSSQDSRYLANLNDLRDLDESLYQGLLKLKNYPGNVDDFSLDFTINDAISMPSEPVKIITRELLPNGANIPVTNENRVLYVSGVARHRLHAQPFQQTRAFLRGLGDIINPSWLSMFNQDELQTLIGGDSSEIDVDDLRRNTIYSGVYQIGDDGQEHPTIQMFWRTMKEMDDADRRKVLRYVTSTPRAPLLGFGQLNPRFSIRDAGSDEQRLPSTSTCINLLKMPRYSSPGALKSKLLYAVNSGAGFDLS